MWLDEKNLTVVVDSWTSWTLCSTTSEVGSEWDAHQILRRTRSMSRSKSINSLFRRGVLHDFFNIPTSPSTTQTCLSQNRSASSSSSPIMDEYRPSDAASALDPFRVAEQVHSLAASDKPIAPLVNEALQVINEALDTHGCVSSTFIICRGELSMSKTGPRQS